MHGRGERSAQGFGGKTVRKETSRRRRRGWENGIGRDLMEIGWGVCVVD
jgi:hypothetical protein